MADDMDCTENCETTEMSNPLHWVQSELALNVHQALSSKSFGPISMESLPGLWMWEIHSIVILLLTTVK